MGEFCKWTKDGNETSCSRCGSVAYHGGEPTCPPFITRVEPDNLRLPHITTRGANMKARQDWLDVVDQQERTEK